MLCPSICFRANDVIKRETPFPFNVQYFWYIYFSAMFPIEPFYYYINENIFLIFEFTMGDKWL